MKEMSEYMKFIHLSRYARWNEGQGRRETWEETVDRYINFFADAAHNGLGDAVYIDPDKLKQAVLSLDVMPSMRALMTAGKALDRDNVAGYNCAYLAIDNPKSFDEAMYILMCGTGVGFSVERKYTSQLPTIAESFHETPTVINVADSKIGWATSYRELLSLLYSGKIPKWDMSKVRGKGERLVTFGGRASGPEPLNDLFEFSVALFKKAAGRKLTSVECHDIMCKIADIVVVGGVRRSALLSLSDLEDERMAKAKAGNWWEEEPHRALANNSVCYTEKPEVDVFMKEWMNLYESKSGERGIFNRQAAKKQAGKNGRRDTRYDFGCNPCSEILLRSKQFCNLTEVVVRPTDTLDSLKRKVEIATILGTLQSTLTSFRYLGREWKKNTEEERLLGVSLTGIMDHEHLSGKLSHLVRGETSFIGGDHMLLNGYWTLQNTLHVLKETAIETNKEWAERLGINPATAITCVKPSGTVSQLVDSSSGIHPRYSEYYIRTVRADQKDPLAEMMVWKGIPVEKDVTKPDSTYVFSFPMKAPEGSVLRNDRTAIQQLELWKVYQDHWCEHKPSVTVYYKPEEFLEVGDWVYKHFDDISGISFLPHTDHVYKQAPYQEITKGGYEEALAEMPKDIDWYGELKNYEKEDTTSTTKELACSAGGGCEI